MACNKIKTLDEVGKLAALPKLQKLILASNPLQCYAGERLDAAPYICRRVPQVTEIDGRSVTATVRK